MNYQTVGFIGGGRVASIILGGLGRARNMPTQVVVSDTNLEVLQKLQQEFPTITVIQNGNQQAARARPGFYWLTPANYGQCPE